MISNLFNSIIDNRYFQRVFLPLSIVNLFRSYRSVRKEWRILKEVINSNDSFYEALATLGFTPMSKTFGLVSIMPNSQEYSTEHIKNIASTTIISVIMKFVKDENLLGIIHVDCDVRPNNMIVTTIRPSSMNILLSDAYDFSWSILITNTIIGLIYLIKHFL